MSNRRNSVRANCRWTVRPASCASITTAAKPGERLFSVQPDLTLQLPFLASRSYLHGTTLFDALTPFVPADARTSFSISRRNESDRIQIRHRDASDKPMLDEYRQSVIHPRSGKALLAAVAAVKSKGPYEIEGKTRKLLPKGFATDPDRVEYLLYEGLYTSIELPADAAREPEFIDICVEHYANTWPIAKWLLDEGIGQ